MPPAHLSTASYPELAQTLFPAGSNGEFNLPPELSIVIQRGVGSRLYDTDGREFIDFSLGWGSNLVGHAHPKVVEAVTRQASQGSNFSYITQQSLLLAQEIVRLSPACDKVRFCASGTEATMYIQRLARAYAGKPKILKFEGAYHGANEIGVISLFPDAPADYPHPVPTSAGITLQALSDVLVAPFNDLETTTQIVEPHAADLAAIIVEPLQRCVPPQRGFLQGLRDLTHRHGILLLFDEVVTGFRLAYGGAQEYYGVVPDLVAYGKALGGGYPIGAFGGAAEIMDIVSESRMGSNTYVWIASTLGGNPVSSAAARAALSVFAEEGVYPRLHQMGENLREGLYNILYKHGIPAQIIGDGPLAQVVFSDQPVQDYRSSQSKNKALGRNLMLGLFRKQIFLNPMGTKLYLSLAHSDSDMEQFLERFENVLNEITTDS